MLKSIYTGKRTTNGCSLWKTLVVLLMWLLEEMAHFLREIVNLALCIRFIEIVSGWCFRRWGSLTLMGCQTEIQTPLNRWEACRNSMILQWIRKERFGEYPYRKLWYTTVTKRDSGIMLKAPEIQFLSLQGQQVMFTCWVILWSLETVIRSIPEAVKKRKIESGSQSLECPRKTSQLGRRALFISLTAKIRFGTHHLTLGIWFVAKKLQRNKKLNQKKHKLVKLTI